MVLFRMNQGQFLPYSCFLFFCIFPLLVQSSIRVPGKNFRSTQEPEAKQLWKGYEYYARLQSLPATACTPNATENFTITPPSDGVPVALLIGTGNICSLDELVSFVENHVLPTQLVDFLILDQYNDHNALHQQSKHQPSILRIPSNESSTTSSFYYFGKHHKKPATPPRYPYYILSVSFESHIQLLDLLMQQSSDSQAAGGPRITIDATSASSTSGLWIALTALIAACSCSFLLLLQGWLEADVDDAEPGPQRPQRRRLTTEQVQNLGPIYTYDGVDTLEGWNDASDTEQARSLPELDECVICLDEFVGGDQVRVLPCQHGNHAFHASCIGKWLSERSSVCPLCKEDYYVEEEEESEEESEDEEEPSTNETWFHGLYRMLTATADDENDEDNTSDAPQQHSGRWWARFFRPSPPNNQDLAEPLLEAAEQENEDDNMSESPASEEEEDRSTVSV